MDRERDTKCSSIMLDEQTWLLLRRLAELRAQRLGGRPSQSAVIRELVRAAGEPKANRA